MAEREGLLAERQRNRSKNKGLLTRFSRRLSEHSGRREGVVSCELPATCAL